MQKTVSTSEIILKKEELSPFLYIITSGKVMIEDSHGVFHLSKNDFFGEDGFFLKKPSSCTAIAADETELMLLTETEFLDFIKEFPELALLIIRKNVARASQNHENFNENNCFYQKILEIIIAVLPKGTSYETLEKAPISLLNIAEKLELPMPSVRALFAMSQSFGDIALDKDSSVLSKGETVLRKRIQQMSFGQYFGFESNFGKKGVGHFNLLNLINK